MTAELDGRGVADGHARDGNRNPGRAEGTSQRLGWFRYFFEDDRWEWSPQVQTMHGYQPG
ncbi:MAG: RNA-binding protein with domain, partial [Mycobacterium sp.]|nr:RNA-binding protein with domain [Mycobacterium sp.]